MTHNSLGNAQWMVRLEAKTKERLDHLIAEATPFEQVLGLPISSHSLVYHLQNNHRQTAEFDSETFSTVNSSSISPIMIPSKARTSETGED